MKLFQIIESLLRLASIAVVIIATELTIFWNSIQGVNDPSSVGQLIPLVLGVGALGHLLLSTVRARFPDPIKARESEMGVVVQRSPFDMSGMSRIAPEEQIVMPMNTTIEMVGATAQNETRQLSRSTAHDNDLEDRTEEK